MKTKQKKDRGQRQINRWSYTNDADECNACEISFLEQFAGVGIGVWPTKVASEVPAVPAEALPEPLKTGWFWARPIRGFIRRFVLLISMPNFLSSLKKISTETLFKGIERVDLDRSEIQEWLSIHPNLLFSTHKKRKIYIFFKFNKTLNQFGNN